MPKSSKPEPAVTAAAGSIHKADDARLLAMSSFADQQLMTLAGQVGLVLRERGQRLATAESCTGGWVAQAITAVAGSSDWFEAGFVTYSNRMKQQLLDVPLAILEGPDAPGAVSAETVCTMAQGAQKHAGADWAVAVSGIAGPGGATATKPVGLVWLAWAHPDGRCISRCFYFDGDRQQVRYHSVVAALEGLLTQLADTAGS